MDFDFDKKFMACLDEAKAETMKDIFVRTLERKGEWTGLQEYSWPTDMFDEHGMLKPENTDAEVERNKRIRDAIWPEFERRNLTDKDILCSPVWRIREFYYGRS